MYNIWVIIIPVIMFSITSTFNKKSKKEFLIMYILFSLMYALRGRVGTDWQGYMEYYNNIFDPVVIQTSGFESGFILLCMLFKALGVSYWGMVFCIRLFVTVLFYKASKNQTSNLGIVALAGVYYFFYPTFEALRQSISLALFFYSLQYYNVDLKKYIFLNVMALLFHRTAIIGIFFVFFQKSMLIKVASFAGVFMFHGLKPFILDFLNFAPIFRNKLIWYTTVNSDYSHLSSLKMLEYIVLLFLLIYMQKGQGKKLLSTELLKMGVWMYGVLPFIIDVTYRFGYYTDIGVMLAYADIYDFLRKRRYRFVYSVFLIAYISLRFFSLIRANSTLFGL